MPSGDFAALCKRAAEGSALWAAGDAAGAEAAFAELLAADEGSPLWPCLLARARLAQGRAAAAREACDAALERLPPTAELHLVRALALLEVGGAEGAAAADLQRARAVGGLGQAASKELAEACDKLGMAGDVAPAAPSAEVHAAPTAAAPAAPTAAAPAAGAQKGAPAAGGAARPGLGAAGGPPAAAAAVEAARRHEAAGSYALARRQCEEALRCCPGEPEAVLCLARMDLDAGRPSAVTRLLRKEHPAVVQQRPWGTEALALLAAVAEREGDWEAAAADLERAVRLARQMAAKDVKPPLQDLLGRLARAHWRSGEAEGATELAQEVLDQHPMQREASEVACAILLDRGDSATALAVMLRCLVGNRHEPSRTCADLVCGVMGRCSVEELMHVLAPEGPKAAMSNSVAEVAAYAGLIMKERSEVLQACRLYREAVLLAPGNASLCLNAMHCYALRRDELGALALAQRYFRKLGGEAAEALCRVLAPGSAEDGSAWPAETPPTLEPAQLGSEGSFYDAMAIGFVVLKLLFLAHPHALAEGQDPAEAGAEPEWRRQLSACQIEQEPLRQKAAPLCSGWCQERAPHAHCPAETAAHRSALRALCSVLDASRKGHNLHLTPVRNEHAYFECIQGVLGMERPPVVPTAEPIFVVGDSHVLSSSWQTVEVPLAEGGMPGRAQLVPSLVTGAKIWHLRESSTFYTKFAFWDRIGAIPSGAPVLLILGEIDCREGILRAVQKGRHNSVQAALEAVVDLYVELLCRVRRRLPRSPLFVHPVPSVLPETRRLTLPFNRLLARPEAAARLTKAGISLLEMPSLFVGGAPAESMSAGELAGLELLPGLGLDGTHLGPGYVGSHLGPALARAWARGVAVRS